MDTEGQNLCFYFTYKQSTSPLCPARGIHTASKDRDEQTQYDLTAFPFESASQILIQSFLCSRFHTNSVWLCRIKHGGGSRDEREQLGVPPLVSGQIPPGIDHLKTDQSIWQGLQEKDGMKREKQGGGERRKREAQGGWTSRTKSKVFPNIVLQGCENDIWAKLS